jgi:uncharacterized membrane protein YqaE (UPF0057 family)
MRILSIKTSIIAFILFAFTSCNTTFDVVKRKYRKGYHISVLNSKIQKSQSGKKIAKIFDLESSKEIVLSDNPIFDSLNSDNLLSIDDQQKSSVIYDPVSVPKKDFNLVSNPDRPKKPLSKAIKRINKKVKRLKPRSDFYAASNDDIDDDLLFLLLLLGAIILPPACVYYLKGKDAFSFKLNLVLFLIGFLGFGLAAIASIKLVWLAYVLAVVHALLILLGYQ